MTTLEIWLIILAAVLLWGLVSAILVIFACISNKGAEAEEARMKERKEYYVDR